MVACFPLEFSLLLLSSWSNFDLLLSFPSSYFKFATFLKDLLAIFELRFCSALCPQDTNMYSVFSVFTYRPTSVVAINNASVLFVLVCTFPLLIGHKWMSPIQFQSMLVCLNHPNDIVKEMKGNGVKASPCFRLSWRGNISDKYFLF
jgi:hypothetical protein